MSGDKDTILRKARETLELARRGLRDMDGSDATRRLPGFHNLVVFGRSVTFVLQNLRTVDAEGFDAWYAPWQEEMSQDPLLRHFKELRNVILKKGPSDVPQRRRMRIEHLDTRDLQPVMSNPPPGAENFFVGDQLGGAGWEVRLPDGSMEKYYVQLPPTVKMRTTFYSPDIPSEHLGQAIRDVSLQGAGRLYIKYLERLVNDAEQQLDP